MRKSPLTLLEIAIAMSLVAILLGSLFGTLWETIKAQSKIEKIKSVIIPRHRLFLRLTQLFSDEASYEVSENPPSLLIKYKSTLDRNPNFRGLLTSFLYIEDKHLFLATWSKTDKRLECLLDKAEKLSCETVIKNEALKITVDGVEFPIFL